MLDYLFAFSLYRQLEGLEAILAKSEKDQVNRFLVAFNSQGAFNEILKQISEQCADAPEYLRSFSHIKPVTIERGIERSVYPDFLRRVTMLKQAIRALLEYSLTDEQKQRIGFI
jgi:hypothetical protein